MKLVMFTPTIKESAIGRMASLVTQALLDMGHAVTVIRAESASLHQRSTHDFGVALIPWTQTSQVDSLVRGADAVIYQVGDNHAYHQGCLEWLPRAQGVVCLHDFFLGHLFTGWAELHNLEARSILRTWYGEDSANNFFSYRSSDEFIAGTKDTTPMTEWIACMADAIITHSCWGLPRVLAACPGWVEVVPLAYNAQTEVCASMQLTRQGECVAEFNILTVGHVNANKRAESVIRAIGNSTKLRECTTYRLVGAIQPDVTQKLQALANEVGVHLVISGEVDADTLASALALADVVSCLRWPSLEAASASAIEAMLHGKPVIVTDTGFYSELPDACVRKINPVNELQDLQRTFEDLHQNSSERAVLGAEAARWASMTFTAENYAERIIEASLAAQRAAPVINAIQSLTGLQHKWGASSRLMTLSDTLIPLQLFDGYPTTAGAN